MKSVKGSLKRLQGQAFTPEVRSDMLSRDRAERYQIDEFYSSNYLTPRVLQKHKPTSKIRTLIVFNLS
jgi:hypothetical protein